MHAALSGTSLDPKAVALVDQDPALSKADALLSAASTHKGRTTSATSTRFTSRGAPGCS